MEKKSPKKIGITCKGVAQGVKKLRDEFRKNVRKSKTSIKN